MEDLCVSSPSPPSVRQIITMFPFFNFTRSCSEHPSSDVGMFRASTMVAKYSHCNPSVDRKASELVPCVLAVLPGQQLVLLRLLEEDRLALARPLSCPANVWSNSETCAGGDGGIGKHEGWHSGNHTLPPFVWSGRNERERERKK